MIFPRANHNKTFKTVMNAKLLFGFWGMKNPHRFLDFD